MGCFEKNSIIQTGILIYIGVILTAGLIVGVIALVNLKNELINIEPIDTSSMKDIRFLLALIRNHVESIDEKV